MLKPDINQRSQAFTRTFMSVGGPIFVLAAVWGFIHVLHRSLTRRKSPFLPTNFGGLDRPRSSFNLWHHHSKVTLHGVHLRISTTKWNALHDKLSGYLLGRGNQRVGVFLREFYNLGSVLGVFGMLTAIVALFWMLSNSAWTLFEQHLEKVAYDIADGSMLAKRASGDVGAGERYITDSSSTFPAITPIVSLYFVV